MNVKSHIENKIMKKKFLDIEKRINDRNEYFTLLYIDHLLMENWLRINGHMEPQMGDSIYF